MTTLLYSRLVLNCALCGAIAVILAMAAPCKAQEPGSSATIDDRCATLSSQKPIPANDHAISQDNYPLLSMANGEAGNVVLDFRINTDGSVDDVRVAHSSGYAELDGAAVDAAKARWRFDPVLAEGKAISCRNKVAVNWTLESTPEQFEKIGFTVVRMAASDYPPDSMARHESGQTVVMALVNSSGKILSALPSRSSGFADLDSAAVNYVKSGKCPVVPPQVSGKPVAAMLGFAIFWSASGSK